MGARPDVNQCERLIFVRIKTDGFSIKHELPSRFSDQIK